MNVPITPPVTAPERVVQEQLDAYNARDLDRWFATYADDAQQFLLHGPLLAAGHPALRARMAERFQDPALRAELIHRMVLGSVVVDHEWVTCTLPEGLARIGMICIYEVADGKIAKATFAIGQPEAVLSPGR